MSALARSWRGLPARARLALWYAVFLAATVIVLGTGVLWLVERALYATADDVLRGKSASVQSEVEIEDGQLEVDSDVLPGTDLPGVAAGLDVVRLWDRRARLSYRRDGLVGLPEPDEASVQAVLADAQRFDTARAADGTLVRLYMEPVRNGKDKIIGVVQVGRSQAEIEAVLRQIQVAGIGGLLVALVLAGVGGSFLAGRALAPVDRIRQAAERIGAGDLGQRLALPLPDDELGRLARAFDGMIGRLDEAFQRQRRFTADAAHELRTPLSIISARAEAARGRPREPEYDRRVLDDIFEEGQRLRGLVESLLTLARIDAGQPLTLAPVDLEDLVAATAERMAPRAHERGLELRTLIEETAPVVGDPTWLTQLLLNLLDNAVRHTPPGGLVTLSLEPAPGGVAVRVADTGEGIAAEHLPHIFERFYRADRARTRSAGGTGLGLAICGWVAEAHHGRLTVASDLGHGTAFTLWLPAQGLPTQERPPVVEPANPVPAAEDFR
jgi:heavy metal sensor kinase